MTYIQYTGGGRAGQGGEETSIVIRQFGTFKTQFYNTMQLVCLVCASRVWTRGRLMEKGVGGSVGEGWGGSGGGLFLLFFI